MSKRNGYDHTCLPCGKKAYESRRDAKKRHKNLYPGEDMDEYPCPEQPDYWHFGHSRR